MSMHTVNFRMPFLENGFITTTTAATTATTAATTTTTTTTATIIIIINTAHVECKNKGDTGNNTGDWDCFKVIQKIREQRTGETRSQGTTENSHIGHCTHNAESTDVKAQ